MHISSKEGFQWGKKKPFSRNWADSETREGQRKKKSKTS